MRVGSEECIIHITFASAMEMDVSRHYSEPHGRYGRMHAYGRDAPDWLGATAAGMTTVALYMSDPVTELHGDGSLLLPTVQRRADDRCRLGGGEPWVHRLHVVTLMNIWMLVYNNCTADQRVLKEAATLSQSGHRLTIVAVLDNTTVPCERRDGIRILRVDRRPLHYRLLWALRRTRRLIRLPLSAALELTGLEQRVAARRADHDDRPVSSPVNGAAVPAGGFDSALARSVRGIETCYRAAGRFGHRNVMRLHKPLMYSDWYWRAYRLARSEQIDAVHVHDLNTLSAAAAIAKRSRAMLVYDAHASTPTSVLSRSSRAGSGASSSRS